MDVLDGVMLIPTEEFPKIARLNGGSVIGVKKENGEIKFTEPHKDEILESPEVQIVGRKK